MMNNILYLVCNENHVVNDLCLVCYMSLTNIDINIIVLTYCMITITYAYYRSNYSKRVFSVLSAGNFYEESYWRDYRVEVRSDGTVFWTYGGIFSTTCSLNIKNYPFDSQVRKSCVHIIRLTRWHIVGGSNLVYNDDQSEPLCICLATMILFYLTDL